MGTAGSSLAIRAPRLRPSPKATMGHHVNVLPTLSVNSWPSRPRLCRHVRRHTSKRSRQYADVSPVSPSVSNHISPLLARPWMVVTAPVPTSRDKPPIMRNPVTGPMLALSQEAMVVPASL